MEAKTRSESLTGRLSPDVGCQSLAAFYPEKRPLRVSSLTPVPPLSDDHEYVVYGFTRLISGFLIGVWARGPGHIMTPQRPPHPTVINVLGGRRVQTEKKTF